jgi:anti-sigma factor RsiW
MSNEPMNCEEALRQLAVYLDGELRGAAHAGVEQHLQTCRSCFSRSEFERRLKAQLSELAHEDVRPYFKQQIQQLIAEFTSASDSKPAGD